MGIIQQNSRISFHTITATGASFSVPTQEDFTSKTSPWSIYDLCLSEIGVNEGDEKAYIRIGSSIKEFEFVGGTAGGESLSDTLAVGNTMSGTITNPDGSGIIQLDATNLILQKTDGNGTYSYMNFDLGMGSIQLSGPNAAFNTSYGESFGLNTTYTNIGLWNTFYASFTMDGYANVLELIDASTGTGTYSRLEQTNTYQILTSINSIASARLINDSSTSIQLLYQDNSGASAFNNFFNISSTNIDLFCGISGTSSSLTLQSIPYSQLRSSDNNSDDGLTLDPNNTSTGTRLYSKNLATLLESAVKLNPTEIKIETSAVSNVIKANTLNTTAAGTYSISTLPTLATSNSITIKAKVIGFSSGSSLTYGSDLFAVFANYGGTVTQISTTDIIEKTDFGASWTSTIDTDGTDIFIKVIAGGTDNTNWKVMYEYIIAS